MSPGMETPTCSQLWAESAVRSYKNIPGMLQGGERRTSFDLTGHIPREMEGENCCESLIWNSLFFSWEGCACDCMCLVCGECSSGGAEAVRVGGYLGSSAANAAWAPAVEAGAVGEVWH